MNRAAHTLHVDFGPVLDEAGFISAINHDLLALAQAAHLEDRRCRRGSSPDDRRWHRQMQVIVPALEPNRWSTPEVSQAATDLLDWLTDDHWDITWAKTDSPPPSSDQAQLPNTASVNQVILFSGGLDAVAGVAHLLPNQALEAVAISTNQVMHGYQRRAINALRQAHLGSLEHQQIDFSVRNGKRDPEITRRTRGLVFLTFGAAMAMRRNRQELVMAENGVGALNLPLTKAQTGTMTSRSAHPQTLRRFEQLIQLVTQQRFRVHTPFLKLTKAEAIELIPESARPACGVSESCDLAASGRGTIERRCGYCTSCLLRRMSLHAAGRANWDQRDYQADNGDTDPDRDRLPEMLWQAATIDRALRQDPSHLETEFPQLRDVPTESLDHNAQHRLLAKYVDEWRTFPHPLVQRFLSPTPLAG